MDTPQITEVNLYDQGPKLLAEGIFDTELIRRVIAHRVALMEVEVLSPIQTGEDTVTLRLHVTRGQDQHNIRVIISAHKIHIVSEEEVLNLNYITVEMDSGRHLFAINSDGKKGAPNQRLQSQDLRHILAWIVIKAKIGFGD